MPIEIKELHILVTVNSVSRQSPSSAGSVYSSPAGGKEEKESVVAECVEQVLQIIQSKRER